MQSAAEGDNRASTKVQELVIYLCKHLDEEKSLRGFCRVRAVSNVVR